MENPISSIKVTEKDLREHLANAQAFVEKTQCKVKVVRHASSLGTDLGNKMVDVDVSLRDLAYSIDPEDALPSNTQLQVLLSVRRGLQFGYHVSEDYRKRSGVASFDSAKDLHRDQLREYNEKMQTAAAIAQFVASRYILWDLQKLATDNTFMGNIPVHVDEVNISTPTKALQYMMFFLGQNVKEYVNSSDDRLVAIVMAYAEKSQQEILNRASSFRYVEFFADITYQLEEKDFAVSGFALTSLTSTMSVEFNRLEFKAIVGNRDGKHFMRMDAKRRMCYDFDRQMNPFLELGGITPVFMGYGIPGTGKSMLISAYATILYDLCQALGYPFLYHPLPDNIVDSFQGNSAKNMVAWMKPLQDPTRIVWAPIDDGENILENRLHQGVSEGVKAVIGVTLRYTEGAYAINRGNSAIGIFTNLPENIDPAIMSRVQARFAIDGARTTHDFLDQDHLWWSKIEKSEPGFVQLRNPEDYEWYASQGNLKSFAEISEDLSRPKESRIREAFHNTLEIAEPDSHMFYAEYFMAVQKYYKLFSSRDVRNIQSAVSLRIMDFDLPDEWFEKPEVFARKDYDTKMSMILEMRKANMKGLSFAEIKMEETNRYLDNMARIADAEFEREVKAGIDLYRKQEAVRNAVLENK